MTKYHCAIDIGASSGRLILGWLEDGKIQLHEVHRFANGVAPKNGHLCWDLERCTREIIQGLVKCSESGMAPSTIAIDTWGVDFVLLDENDVRIGDAVSYRDDRTKGMDEKVFAAIGAKELYSRTGIQHLQFNTIFQLQSIALDQPEVLAQASRMLMIPEYLNFFLTGKKVAEYTNATTTQLVNAEQKDWDRDIISRLGFPERIFLPLSMPGTSLGGLESEIRDLVGFDAEVLLAPSHDTASAVAAVPFADTSSLFISSGTWSLMGAERGTPNCSEESRLLNFSNEGGYGYRFRYLKNIMGLWMIQSIRKELPGNPDFETVMQMAISANAFPSRVNVNDEMFLAPSSMRGAIVEYCKREGSVLPQSDAEIISCAYHSLAECYAETAREIDGLAGRRYERIHIVGGGIRDKYLSRLTAVHTGKEVLAGPVEATALGNLLSQCIAKGEFDDLAAGRGAIRESFPVVNVGR